MTLDLPVSEEMRVQPLNRVVVLMMDSECEEYPGAPCVMDVLGPFTEAQAREVAGAAPAWTRPHIMRLNSEWE